VWNGLQKKRAVRTTLARCSLRLREPLCYVKGEGWGMGVHMDAHAFDTGGSMPSRRRSAWRALMMLPAKPIDLERLTVVFVMASTQTDRATTRHGWRTSLPERRARWTSR
jgi:hypothetical protein